MVKTIIKGWVIKCGKILGILACLPIFIYLLLLGASHVYISGGAIEEFFSLTDINPVWQEIESLNLPGLSNPGPIRVERVGVLHAIRNAIFIFCTDALIALVPPAALLLGIFLILAGLFEANWSLLIFGIFFGIVITLLSPIVVVFLPIVLWLVLLFQSCTPAYVLLWLVIGLPFALLGFGAGAAPSVTIIKIVNPGVVEVVIRDK